MEAMSRTASAVAHDFNNRLTVIRSVAGLRRDAGGAAPRLHEDMDEILGAVDRGASLSAHRLAFCRAQPAEPQAVDLGALLVADPLQLEQVLLDLASNAADVMPFGGELRIRAAPRTVDDAVPSRYGATAPGTYATLTVTDTDTGTGMTLEVLARPGEPFLSTKPQGRGTGLGLATVYGIVQQPGGGLTVESTPGIGTSITVYLPSAGTAA